MFHLLTYTLGLFLGILFCLLRFTGRVTIFNASNLRRIPQGTLIISNHPSILDGLVIPLLFFPHLLTNPSQYIPWTTLDKKNFYDAWYFLWMRFLRTIPIDRLSKKSGGNKEALEKIFSVLEEGDSVVLFPEGGRTSKQAVRRKSSKYGKEIGVFKKGAETIVQKCGCNIVPLWIEGTDKVLPIGGIFPRFWRSKITVRVGKPIQGNLKTTDLEDALLVLADET